jgi:AraC-like DNA-binding protein
MTVSPKYLADHPATESNMTEPPEDLADPLAIEDGSLGLGLYGDRGDLLSDLLRSVRLRGERMVAYAPPPTFSIGFTGIGALHIVEQGEMQLEIDADEHVTRVRRGDVILLPRGDAHHISSKQRQTERANEIGGRADDRVGAGQPARWLCGTFTIDDSQASHLLASLPAVVILRGARDQALEWLEVSRRMLLYEMQSPSQGSVVMVARILDLLFIQILRAWAAGPNAEPNWLAGALDPQIGPALGAIHSDPARDWTVEDLAKACNLSRSLFAERFSARVGKPPANYLTSVRLDAAAALLTETSQPVTMIAQKVGYTSEAAFSRAFRQRYGEPPSRWRRTSRSA